MSGRAVAYRFVTRQIGNTFLKPDGETCLEAELGVLSPYVGKCPSLPLLEYHYYDAAASIGGEEGCGSGDYDPTHLQHTD